MSTKQTVYFMALVGAMAGLGCWALQAWIGVLLEQQRTDSVAFTAIVTAIMGALIGGLTVGFADHWAAERVVARWVVVGVVLGTVAGTLGGLLYSPISALMQSSPLNNWVGIPLLWLLAGGLIGLATGL